MYVNWFFVVAECSIKKTYKTIETVDNILEILIVYPIEFVSSPDIGFLRSNAGKSNKATKVIFQLLNTMDVEQTPKQPNSHMAL